MKYLAYEALWAKKQREVIYSFHDSVHRRREEERGPEIINEID